jgi:replicative DNA helicase
MIDALPETKSLPHSEESERAVLAGILLHSPLLATVSGRLVSTDFYVERHALIYQAMLDLQNEGVDIDVRTLQAKLEQQDTLEAVGGVSYLASLDLDLPDLGRLDAYVDIVKERSVRRQLIEAATPRSLWRAPSNSSWRSASRPCAVASCASGRCSMRRWRRSKSAPARR